MSTPPTNPKLPIIPIADSATQKNLVTFMQQGIQPPSNVYMQPDDILMVGITALSTGRLVTFRGRFLDTQGNIKPFEFTPNVTITRARQFFTFPLAEGFLLSINAFTLSGTNNWGDTHAAAMISRKGAALTDTAMTLFAGYLTFQNPLGWPEGGIHQGVEGPGNIRIITGTDPIAGAEMSETVPLGAIWRLMSLRIQLVTSAVAGNRVVQAEFDDGAGNVFGRATPSAVQAASLTFDYTIGSANALGSGAGGNVGISMSDNVRLPPGSRIRTKTSLLDVGDNFGAPVYIVEENLNGLA